MAAADSARAPGGAAGDAVGAARWRALTALVALERERATRLRDALRVDDLDARDRALALELALGVERRRLTLDAILGQLAARHQLPQDPYLKTALRLGAYQVLFLPRVPPHAAVASAVGLVQRQRAFANAVLRRLAALVVTRAADAQRPRAELRLPPGRTGDRTLALPADVLPDPQATPDDYLSVLHGVPVEFVARWHANHGIERAAAVAAASAATPGVTLRVHASRTSAEDVRRMLAGEGVATTPMADPRLLRLTAVEGPSPFSSRAYHDGLFSVQDATALCAVDAVAAVPGETILDLCAAPGGKATALAEALAGQGLVLAHDRDARRLALVQQAVARLRLAPTLQVIEDLGSAPAACDAVLVDVPCSNTGVMARRVEVRRRPLLPSLRALVPEQAALLRLAIARTRPGGRVVYSTCSLEPEENRGVVDAVLAEGGRARLERELLTWPQGGSHDGGYFAVLRLYGS